MNKGIYSKALVQKLFFVVKRFFPNYKSTIYTFVKNSKRTEVYKTDNIGSQYSLPPSAIPTIKSLTILPDIF